MSMKLLRLLVGIIVLLFSNASIAWAGDTRVHVQLVWGTDNAKPKDRELTDLDEKAREKLRHLRWKNYWVVKAETPAINDREFQKVTLDRCVVEIKDIGHGQIEVRLHTIKDKGELKHVKTVHHPMSALKNGEFLILAGDDKAKWDDAWIVIIHSPATTTAAK
jgi:hypothetical protein